MVPTITPFPKQYKAYQYLWDAYTWFLVYGGGAGGGKSWLGAEWLITNCYRYPGTRWFIGRNELKRLMMTSYITFQKVCKYHKIPPSDWKLNAKYNYIQWKNGSVIDLLDLAFKPSDLLYERFGSGEYTGGWIEEGGEVNFGAFDVMKGRIGRHMNKEYGLPPKLLITCNPKKNWLYRLVYKLWKTGKLSREYAFIQSLYKDNPHTAEEYGRMLAQITDEILRKRLKDGDWEYDDDPGTMMDYDGLVDMFTNQVDESGEKYLVCDAARNGKDKIVYTFWKGWLCYKVAFHQRQGLDVTVQRIREFSIKERIPYSHILVDEEGVGGGIVDNMKGIKGFIGNSSPLEDPKKKEQYKALGQLQNEYQKPNYLNLRAQTAFMFADKVNTHEVAVRTESSTIQDYIIEELMQIRKKDPEKEQKLRIIPKEEIIEDLGRSPDFADALMMRGYFDLTPRKFYRQTSDVGGVKPYIESVG